MVRTSVITLILKCVVYSDYVSMNIIIINIKKSQIMISYLYLHILKNKKYCIKFNAKVTTYLLSIKILDSIS